ncbi:MAG: phosphonoacetaldehyde reductase [Akkermansiaceae bacterium]|nr:phosphonoacetaldehyde reductase [Akkermansiaceae bacterium]
MPEQQHYHGDDGWAKVAEYLDAISADRILLVTGNRMYCASGAEQALEPILSNKEVTHLSCCHTNPRVEDITALLDQIDHKESYQAIIAVGGGSVIDAAKLMKAFWSNPLSLDDYLGCEDHSDLLPAPLPLIAMPSTAGSGSEATRFAVVYKNKEKYSVEHDELLPTFSVVIPSLLKSVPSHTAAASGMDALCQGIESYWSIHSTDESRQLAKGAIELAWNWIESAVIDHDPVALEHMAEASHLAGRAINITKTTAPHAVSYPMTSHFGITHGHAVGLLTARFLDFNQKVTEEDCLDNRGVDWVKGRLREISCKLGASETEEASDSLLAKMRNLGLATTLPALGIKTQDDVEIIIQNGFDPARVKNNPRAVSESALRKTME